MLSHFSFFKISNLSLLILLVLYFSATALDSLVVVEEFDSPISNPRALEFDGTQFWVGSLHSPALYRYDKNFQVIDTTAALPFARIAGITFKDGETWIARDSVVAESLVVNPNSDSLYYNIYCIYRLSENNALSDSIRITASATNANDTNHLSGLTFLNGHFYVSFHGGWGPCMYKVNPDTKEVTELFCSAFGMSAINDEWWGVSGGINGTYLVTMDESGAEDLRYKIYFNPVDLTYDGSTFWLCDYNNSRICRMNSTSVSVKEKPAPEKNISLKQQGKNLVIMYPGTKTANMYVYTLNGKLVKTLAAMKPGIIEWNGSDNKNSTVPDGCYILQLQTGVKKHCLSFMLIR